MSKLVAALTVVVHVVRTYPALSAALVNAGVAAAGYFGLHITAGQLVAYIGMFDVLFGALVHSNVIPLAKVPPVPPVVVVPPVKDVPNG